MKSMNENQLNYYEPGKVFRMENFSSATMTTDDDIHIEEKRYNWDTCFHIYS
jgi:hypothetical protein